MSIQTSRIPLSNITIPASWEVGERNRIKTAKADVMLTGPRDGEYISIKIRPNNDVIVSYTPIGYDATQLTNTSYLSRYNDDIEQAVADIGRFLNGADPDDVFDSKYT